MESLSGAGDELGEAVREYGQYARLRQHALGSVAPSCPPDLEVPEFPDLAELQVGMWAFILWITWMLYWPN